MLALGCVREAFVPPSGGGLLRWAKPASQVFLQGQSSGAVGGAYLLLGDRPNAPKRVFRLEATAPTGLYSLDGAAALDSMEHLGQTLARHRMDQLLPLFFEAPVEPIDPLPDDATDSSVS
jgi:hypothetical protein